MGHATRDDEAKLSEIDLEAVEKANATGRTPVVFIHGLWLLPSSWDRWAEVFEAAGSAALTPGWPDDPETVEEANAHPEVFAGKTVAQVAGAYDTLIRRLDQKPAVIGHSFGGLLAQIIAGRGLASACVAIDSAPFRGVLPLPISALRSAAPVLHNPANRHRAIPLTYEQFRFGLPTPSARTRPSRSTRSSPCPHQARRCSRPRPRTSTRGPRPRPTSPTPSGDRC